MSASNSVFDLNNPSDYERAMALVDAMTDYLLAVRDALIESPPALKSIPGEAKRRTKARGRLEVVRDDG